MTYKIGNAIIKCKKCKSYGEKDVIVCKNHVERVLEEKKFEYELIFLD